MKTYLSRFIEYNTSYNAEKRAMKNFGKEKYSLPRYFYMAYFWAVHVMT